MMEGEEEGREERACKDLLTLREKGNEGRRKEGGRNEGRRE